jgi:hypothetical protein
MSSSQPSGANYAGPHRAASISSAPWLSLVDKGGVQKGRFVSSGQIRQAGYRKGLTDTQLLSTHILMLAPDTKR